MTSSKPYLIRALYQWVIDNAFTPYLLVNADIPDCVVPRSFVKQGKIVLDISMNAAQHLTLGDEAIVFKAGFSGKAMELYIPMQAISAIYAAENGEGMSFPDEPNANQGTEDKTDTTQENTPKKGKPQLKIVD